jgi:hypothetical protein
MQESLPARRDKTVPFVTGDFDCPNSLDCNQDEDTRHHPARRLNPVAEGDRADQRLACRLGPIPPSWQLEPRLQCSARLHGDEGSQPANATEAAAKDEYRMATME